MGLEKSASTSRSDLENSGREVFLSPRIYEVHDQVSAFQLRVYLLWARELHTPQSSQASLVRVFFLNQCQQTLFAENSLNPFWNETLIFEKVCLMLEVCFSRSMESRSCWCLLFYIVVYYNISFAAKFSGDFL